MVDVRSLVTAEAPESLLNEIRRLLDDSFESFSDDDWEHALGGWHVIVSDGGAVVAHAAVVPRTLHVADRPFRTGYVEGVGVAPAKQREGLGSLAMVPATDLVRRNFEMGALATGSHVFYEKLGWERWVGPSFVRDGTRTIRTEEDDDALMVLRFGPSTDVDLTAPLSCQSRSGDDW